MKGYCETEDIENYLLIEIDPAFESQVEKWIEVIEKYIDRHTGRNFKADDKTSVRLYEVSARAENFGTQGGRNVFIDDCIAEEPDDIVLKIDGEVIDPEDYLLYPANGLPKTRIRLKSGAFPSGEQNIEVEGKWGYSAEVPADISFATTVFIAGIINYSLQHEGEVASESIGNYSVAYKTETQWQDFNRALAILDSYKRIL